MSSWFDQRDGSYQLTSESWLLLLLLLLLLSFVGTFQVTHSPPLQCTYFTLSTYACSTLSPLVLTPLPHLTLPPPPQHTPSTPHLTLPPPLTSHSPPPLHTLPPSLTSHSLHPSPHTLHPLTTHSLHPSPHTPSTPHLTLSLHPLQQTGCVAVPGRSPLHPAVHEGPLENILHVILEPDRREGLQCAQVGIRTRSFAER